MLSVINVWRRLGYWPNYRRPSRFNEHFLREKVHFSGDINLARTLTDKVDFKEWLTDHGYESYVIPTLMVAETVDQMRSEMMPSRCVIKPAHSSGDLIILNEKKPRHLTNDELARISSWLNEDYYRRGREPNYKGLKRRVIVEDLLLDSSGQPPRDYKFECAAGEPFMIQVDINRFSGHVRQLYSGDWQLLPYCTSLPRHPTPSPPPSQLSLAMDIARKLSAPFRLCRVDLYLLGDNEIKIGEVTFYPANCAEIFEPRSGDLEAGRLIESLLQNHVTRD
ncbi:ATP-grasp fold amidoligase family protein [Aquabacterium sp.]|uniref:ATP-grasp fold amidoligase family protein n=1 Tax=Aquabacterium sp. TaxID=1872578 RepID=UPI003BB05F9A